MTWLIEDRVLACRMRYHVRLFLRTLAQQQVDVGVLERATEASAALMGLVAAHVDDEDVHPE